MTSLQTTVLLNRGGSTKHHPKQYIFPGTPPGTRTRNPLIKSQWSISSASTYLQGFFWDLGANNPLVIRDFRPEVRRWCNSSAFIPKKALRSGRSASPSASQRVPLFRSVKYHLPAYRKFPKSLLASRNEPVVQLHENHWNLTKNGVIRFENFFFSALYI